MSIEKTPFETAEDNIRKFAENAEMLHNLTELTKLLEDTMKLSPEEQEGVHSIINMAVKNLSNYLVKKGGRWN